ncbi:MAG: FAD:protein FMN transferase, partial [Chitinispirillaceae bacterium]|nr:FAD:protein FMN transferase [Chitinispirillaceae bacterium]
NIKNYLVVAGGDIVAKGNKPDGKPWLIGIRHPRKADGILATLPFTNGSIVTSGDYERFRIVNGKRYHHIFHSKTGRCCNNNQSVTIAGLDPREVDILSTGLFCLPAKDIVDYVNKRSHLECVVVDSAGTIYISDGWKSKIKIVD